MSKVQTTEGNRLGWAFIAADALGPCLMCGGLTVFVDVNFECHLHPGECERSMVAGWRAAERAAGPCEPWDEPVDGVA